MSAQLFLVASVVSALPWYIEVGDTKCAAVAEAPDTSTVLVGCTDGVHAVDVATEKVVQRSALPEVAAIAVDSTHHYAYLLQASNVTVVRTRNIATTLTILDLAPFGVVSVKSAHLDTVRGYLFVATTTGVVVVNVKVPRRPVVVFQDTANAFELTSGAYQVSTQVFVGGVSGGVVVYDMSNPLEGALVVQKEIMGGNAQVGLVGTSLAVCMVGTLKPLYVYDITDPTTLVFTANEESEACSKIATDAKTKVCTASSEKADVWKVAGTSVSTPNGFSGNLGSISAALSGDGNILYMGLSSRGLGLYNVTFTSEVN